MLRLVRLECNNFGPYTHPLFHYDPVVWEMLDKHGNDTKKWPVPFDDFESAERIIELTVQGGEHVAVFGCASIPLLKKWFRGYYGYLIMLGFEVKEYLVSEDECWFSASGKQVLFLIP
jgi:hypothetical protein